MKMLSTLWSVGQGWIWRSTKVNQIVGYILGKWMDVFENFQLAAVHKAFAMCFIANYILGNTR